MTAASGVLGSAFGPRGLLLAGLPRLRAAFSLDFGWSAKEYATVADDPGEPHGGPGRTATRRGSELPVNAAVRSVEKEGACSHA